MKRRKQTGQHPSQKWQDDLREMVDTVIIAAAVVLDPMFVYLPTHITALILAIQTSRMLALEVLIILQ